MLSKISSLLLASAVLSMVSFGVFAAPVNHAGSDCVSYYGGDIRYTGDGVAYNNHSTGTAYVLCQVQHLDFDGFLNPGEINSGWVNVIDLNNESTSSLDNFYCRFRGTTLNSNGSIHRDYGSPGQSSGLSTGKQTLFLGGLHENAQSSYTLWCRVPDRSANGYSQIYTYRVNH